MAEYTLIAKASIDKVREVDDVCKTCHREIATAESAGDHIAKGLIAGAAMQKMRALLTDDLMIDIMALVGSPLGIKTDKDQNPPNGRYPVAIVRDAVLGGLLKGARVVGNEINVIGGNLYLTKEYWERRFLELPGVSSVSPPSLGIPREHAIGDKKYGLVQAKLTWRQDGKLASLECTGDDAILVVWNKGMGIDALHGKAKKRLFATAYAQVVGGRVDLDDEDVIDGNSRPAQQSADYSPPLLDRLSTDLAACEEYGQCDVAGNAYLDECKSDEERKAVSAAVGARKQQIKQGRGERSNKQ